MALTKSEILADESKFQQACSLWVGRNIGWCVSSLMCDIGQNLEECSRIFDFDYDEALDWFRSEDWKEPVENLICDADLDDLERIADMVGCWDDVLIESDVPEVTSVTDENGADWYIFSGQERSYDDEDDAIEAARLSVIDVIREKVSDLITNDNEYREIADEFDLDPDTHEVYEHWQLQERWTARELEAHGETVFEFGGMMIWGRCTTGQSLALDGVVRNIVRGYDEDHWIWKVAI